jgi:hypothetical protein
MNRNSRRYTHTHTVYDGYTGYGNTRCVCGVPSKSNTHAALKIDPRALTAEGGVLHSGESSVFSRAHSAHTFLALHSIYGAGDVIVPTSEVPVDRN